MVEDRGDLVRRAEARIESFAQEREPEAQHEPEPEAEYAVAARPRLNLRGTLRPADDDGVRLLERDERLQLVGLLLELLRVGDRDAVAGRAQLRDPRAQLPQRVLHRLRV